MKVVAISYAKRALEPGSREQGRMKEYAQTLDTFALVVLTRLKDGLPSEYVDGNLHIYGTQARTRLGMLVGAFFIILRIIVKTEKEDWVVSSQDPFETSIAAYLVSLIRGVKLHVQVHGDPCGEAAVDSPKLLQRLRLLWMLFVLKRAAKIRVVSKRVAESFTKSNIPLSKIAVLPIRPNLQLFLEAGNQRTYDSNDTVTFLYVGRLVKGKNVDVIIQAFAQVRKGNKNTHLRLVGDGPLKSSLAKQVLKLGMVDAVTFIPWTNKVAKEMIAADVFVFMSAHEGYGLVLLEAMATGLPIITTDVGCVGELIHNNDQALVVAPTASFCADAMHTLVRTPQKRVSLGKAGISVAEREIAQGAEYKSRWRDSF